MLRSGEAAGLDCGGSSRASAAPAPGAGHVMCHLAGVVWTRSPLLPPYRPASAVSFFITAPLSAERPLAFRPDPCWSLPGRSGKVGNPVTPHVLLSIHPGMAPDSGSAI